MCSLSSFSTFQAFGATLPEWISFGKIRAAYSQVGSDTDVSPYSINLFYPINPQQFPNSNGVPRPLASIAGSVVPNPDLRPMTVTSVEPIFQLNTAMVSSVPTYTNAEINVNHTNVQQAISRQGPDVMDTRVWWDVK